MTAADWVMIISAIASGVVLILGAIAALWVKVHGYRTEVNGRMDQLLELTHSSAIAQGRLAHSIEQASILRKGQADGPAPTGSPA